jgi:bis(5'-nucleosyl)-tetraphosphatase (symmetrical)
MATYIVGDIQGCCDALRRLLDKIHFDPAADQLWCPGDLVNRGGQSLETLRLLYSLGDAFTFTLGNHDLYLLRENWRFPEGGSKNREMDKILQAQDRETLMEWLLHQPLAHWSPEYGVLMVHAGLVPQWDLEQTLSCAGEVEAVLRSDKRDRFFARMRKGRARRWDDQRSGWKRRNLICNILTRLRFCDANGKVLGSVSGPPGAQPPPYLPWFKHPNRRTRNVVVAFGHWAALGLRIKKHVICMDSGCVWGGRLSALRLEDRRLYQVPGYYRMRRIV